MSTVGAVQEEGAARSFVQTVLKLLLLLSEGTYHSMNAVYVLSNRNNVRGWRRRETETKAAKTADTLHVLSAAGDGSNVRQKPISRHGG